jgi:Na+-transporting methylmalonyl-CoA/oxaloacetate decarboxylase gamma subunit
MTDLVNISLPTAGGYALLGYCVVFFGLVLLMIVIMVMGKIMMAKNTAPATQPKDAAAPVPAAPAVPAEKAPGTAGEFKLYNTDPRDAAMVMAIVADSLGKPINELRFISIREVKEDEV